MYIWQSMTYKINVFHATYFRIAPTSNVYFGVPRQ